MGQEYDIPDACERLTTGVKQMADIRKPRADFSDVQGGSSSTAPAPETTAPTSTYPVVKGDSLSKIAKQLWGDASLWPRIYDANRATIKNPDLIHPGQVLAIPVR
jgi:nucleoid-associated protein YgaU